MRSKGEKKRRKNWVYLVLRVKIANLNEDTSA